MSGLYRVTGENPVQDVAPGDILTHDFSHEEEEELVNSGQLLIMPRVYRNTTVDTNVHNAAPGELFEATLSKGSEEHLTQNGFAEVTDEPAGKPGEPDPAGWDPDATAPEGTPALEEEPEPENEEEPEGDPEDPDAEKTEPETEPAA